jgi:hypothetical protein
MVVRGCGKRVNGGIYVETTLSRFGQPLENFLFCPPKLLDKAAIGATNLGVTVLQDPVDPDTVHILDIVGASNYPNVADIVEEIRRHGASRKVSPLLPWSKITPASRLCLAHDSAILTNAAELHDLLIAEAKDYMLTPGLACPKQVAKHAALDFRKMCLALLYEVVEGGTNLNDPNQPVRQVTRKVGDTEYEARRAPLGFVPEWAPGIFAALPINRLVVIDDPDDPEAAQAKLDLISYSSVVTELVDD